MKQLGLFDYPIYKIKQPIRLIELFAGIGTQAMALRDIGVPFERYKVVENDPYTIKGYNIIHGTNFGVSDIKEIKGEDLEIKEKDKYCYIMTYSFPCTDLSCSGIKKGMNKGDGTRSGLLWEVERLLNESDELPQVLIMENVTQVHSIRNIESFNKWMEFLNSKGYKNYWQDLNSKNYGVPQNRNRCFMVSILGEYRYDFPKEINLKKAFKDCLEKEVEEKYYIDKGVDIKELEKKDNKESKENVLQLGNLYEACIGGGFDGIYSKKGLCPSLRCKNIPLIIEDGKTRRLTPIECWRLMGMSEIDYEKCRKICCDTRLYKQAGNAIVKDVMIAVFKQFF